MFAPVLGHRLMFSPTFIAESRGQSKEEILAEVYRRCTELAPPPELAEKWSTPISDASLAFPLVPRWRPVGLGLRAAAGGRRGLGSSVATTRPYRPGDDPGMIDWKLSARLSSIRGGAEFLVREDFADEAPRAVFVGDRAPSMSLYPDDLPWLSKPACAAERLVGGRGGLGAGARTGGLPRHGTRRGMAGAAQLPRLRRRRRAAGARGFDGPAARDRRGVRATDPEPPLDCRPAPSSSSARTSSPPPRPETWLRALGHRWDVVPVVVQDPVWEQSFPLVDGLVIPFADPATGRLLRTRVSRKEALRRRDANEARLAGLLHDFHSLGLDHVVIGDSTPRIIQRAFNDWAEARIANRRGEWR